VDSLFKYILIAAYVILTYLLSFWGWRKARSLAGFSIGNRDMSAILVGLTLAASIASTATFVINPGFVYTHGMSAFLHYGVAGFFGIAAALISLSKGFRGLETDTPVLTIPHWIRLRYGSQKFSIFFALINLLSITFVVLILVGCALLCSSLFGITQKAALIWVLLFVFSYVLMGGVYAHAYTNAFQGGLMVVICLIIFFSGTEYLDGNFFTWLEAVSPNFAAAFNPESTLYYDAFSVLISSFLITFALMMQPHILTKVLYLKDASQVRTFLTTALTTGLIFSLMFFVGFFARFKGLDIAEQDKVVVTYIAAEFGSSILGRMLLALISVALLAAGMSTLDGILVALSAMVVNDLVLPFRNSSLSNQGLALSRYVLVAVALIALLLAWNPPPLVGLFAQKGVYGIAAASFVPIIFGVWIRGPIPTWIAATAAAVGLGGHLILNLFLNVRNPSVSASWAMIASLVLAGLLLWIHRMNAKKPEPTTGGFS